MTYKSMNKKKIEIEFYQGSLKDLSTAEIDLVNKAKLVSNNAYAVYSGFMVGACVLLKNGEIFTGNNQENVAYPSGLCAERVAIFSAASQFPEIEISTIAITAHSSTLSIKEQISPCGSCRQVIAEYEVKQNSPIKIILHSYNEDKVLIFNSIINLLPFLFKNSSLKRH